ncbi:MAG: hypothetical protein ACOCP8_06205 [archaeon]
MKCIVTKSSIINRCNRDGKLHLFMTEKERPCEEATLTEMIDKDGEKCSRFIVELETIDDIDNLGQKYNVDVLVTRNTNFEDYIALVLYDEEIDQNLF